MAKVKNYDFVKEYFKDPVILLNAIKIYQQISKIEKDEYSLIDLLNK